MIKSIIVASTLIPLALADIYSLSVWASDPDLDGKPVGLKAVPSIPENPAYVAQVADMSVAQYTLGGGSLRTSMKDHEYTASISANLNDYDSLFFQYKDETIGVFDYDGGFVALNGSVDFSVCGDEKYVAWYMMPSSACKPVKLLATKL